MKTRCGLRPSSSGRYGISPYSIMDFYVQSMARMGIHSFWIYDCLYDMPEMERLARVVHAAGAEPVPAVMYGISPIHTDEWFAARVREMVGWGVSAAIYVEDASGILKPERARTLLPAMVEAAGDVPVELHCHNTTGMAPLNYLIGVECRDQPRPRGEQTRRERALAAVDRDDARQPRARPATPTGSTRARSSRSPGTWRRSPARRDTRSDAARSTTLAIYDHQLPGGMTGTFKAQLAAEGIGGPLRRRDRRDPTGARGARLPGVGHALLAVHRDPGADERHLGERYATTIDELALYVLGAYGQPPAPIDPDVKDRILELAARSSALAAGPAPR